MPFTVTRELSFSYGHRLLGYPGKCHFLHGHNGRVEVTMAADSLNEQGMVVDFGEIRATLEDWVDKTLDHHTILSQDDPLVSVLQEQGQLVLVLETPPTTENLARFIFQQARKLGFSVLSVRVWETPKSFARYTEPSSGTSPDLLET